MYRNIIIVHCISSCIVSGSSRNRVSTGLVRGFVRGLVRGPGTNGKLRSFTNRLRSDTLRRVDCRSPRWPGSRYGCRACGTDACAAGRWWTVPWCTAWRSRRFWPEGATRSGVGVNGRSSFRRRYKTKTYFWN